MITDLRAKNFIAIIGAAGSSILNQRNIVILQALIFTTVSVSVMVYHIYTFLLKLPGFSHQE